MKVYIASFYLLASIITTSEFTNLDIQKYDGALIQDTYKETATFHKDWRLASLVIQDEYDRQKRNASGNAVIYDVPMGADYNEIKDPRRKRRGIAVCRCPSMGLTPQAAGNVTQRDSKKITVNCCQGTMSF